MMIPRQVMAVAFHIDAEAVRDSARPKPAAPGDISRRQQGMARARSGTDYPDDGHIGDRATAINNSMRLMLRDERNE